jgi:phospholipid/cholesterol/gamma-HCH transport system substrate-binding protein
MQDKVAFKVGLVSFFMAIAIGVLMIWKSGMFFKANGYKLVGQFDSVGGLLPGAEVRYRGYKVGKVFDIIPQKNGVQVYFWVKNGVEIPSGSILRVVFDGLVGEKFLAIRTPEQLTDVALKPGDVMSGYASAGLADAVEIAAKNLEHTEAILRSMRGVFTNQDVANSLKSTILSLQTLTENVSRISGQLGDGAAMKDLAATLKNVRKLTENLQGITNSVNKEDVGSTVKNFSIVSEKLRNFVDDSPEAGDSPFKTLKGITKVQLKPELGVMVSDMEKKGFYMAQLDIEAEKNFLRTGFSDKNGVSEMTVLQFGQKLNDKFTGRVGAFNNKAGVGMDYHVLKGTTLSVDVFNPTKVQLEVTGKTKVNKNFDVFVNLRSDPKTQSGLENVGVGVMVHP